MSRHLHRAALARADAVFRGRVTARTVAPSSSAPVDLRFSVDAVWKGTAYADQVVWSASSGASCGLQPDLGSTWLLFATENVDGFGDDAVVRLTADRCDGSRSSTTVPTVLGLARAPTPGASDRNEKAVATDRRLTAGVVVTVLGIVGLVVVTSVGVAVRWRRRSAGE